MEYSRLMGSSTTFKEDTSSRYSQRKSYSDLRRDSARANRCSKTTRRAAPTTQSAVCLFGRVSKHRCTSSDSVQHTSRSTLSSCRGVPSLSSKGYPCGRSLLQHCCTPTSSYNNCCKTASTSWQCSSPKTTSLRRGFSELCNFARKCNLFDFTAHWRSSRQAISQVSSLRRRCDKHSSCNLHSSRASCRSTLPFSRGCTSCKAKPSNRRRTTAKHRLLPSSCTTDRCAVATASWQSSSKKEASLRRGLDKLCGVKWSCKCSSAYRRISTKASQARSSFFRSVSNSYNFSVCGPASYRGTLLGARVLDAEAKDTSNRYLHSAEYSSLNIHSTTPSYDRLGAVSITQCYSKRRKLR